MEYGERLFVWNFAVEEHRIERSKMNATIECQLYAEPRILQTMFGSIYSHDTEYCMCNNVNRRHNKLVLQADVDKQNGKQPSTCNIQNAQLHIQIAA